MLIDNVLSANFAILGVNLKEKKPVILLAKWVYLRIENCNLGQVSSGELWASSKRQRGA